MTTEPDTDKEALCKSAEQLMSAGKYSEAAALYGRLAEQYPGDTSFLLAQAWAYHDNGQRDEAIVCFEQLFAGELKLKVFTGFAFDELVRLYKDGRQYDRLVAICRQAVEAQPEEYPLLRELGGAYFLAGMASEAVKIFEELTCLEPDAPELFCLLGDALVAAGRFDAAEGAYQQAIALDPEGTALFCQRLANDFIETGVLDRAEIQLNRSLEIRPDDPLCLIRLAEVQVKDRRFPDARRSVEAAIASNPRFAASYYNRLGRALADAECHRDAVEMFDRAIALEKNNAFYYLYQAESYDKLNLPEQAEEARRKAESLSPRKRA
ncbi:MAG: tetratricopeptide repeat protein [Syntrophus sp. PtaU1.Bin208]|nr:MAG: tetratricopeptide repeat protein [Syntrophus sp. PtaU1.Bin208]